MAPTTAKARAVHMQAASVPQALRRNYLRGRHEMSSRAQRGCGFTFEVQQFGEKDLGRGPELEALSRGVVVCRDASLEDNVVDGVEVCLSGQEPAQSADGVLHGALLPRTVRVADDGP